MGALEIALPSVDTLPRRADGIFDGVVLDLHRAFDLQDVFHASTKLL